MKSMFNFIFSKKTKSTFQNSNFYNAGHTIQTRKISENESQLSIFDNVPKSDSYQVTEISFDEFKSSAVSVERRKFPRKTDGTRSAYSIKE